MRILKLLGIDTSGRLAPGRTNYVLSLKYADGRHRQITLHNKLDTDAEIAYWTAFFERYGVTITAIERA